MLNLYCGEMDIENAFFSDSTQTVIDMWKVTMDNEYKTGADLSKSDPEAAILRSRNLFRVENVKLNTGFLGNCKMIMLSEQL